MLPPLTGIPLETHHSKQTKHEGIKQAMIRLAKYTKPYLGMLLLAIVLLFAQANFDLALPDYLSRIVNTGIQQGGIENAVPQAIRASEMERLTIFLSAEEKTLVDSAYTLVNADSADYAQLVTQYPALESEAIYVLSDASPEVIDRLNPVMARALTVVVTLKQMIENPDQAPAMGGDGLGFDLTKIPPGMDLFAMLKMLPPAQVSQISDKINERFAALDEKMIIQAGVAAVKQEYADLGVDTTRLQMAYMLRVGALMLLLTLGSGATTVAVGYLSARTAAGMARDMRRDVFVKVQNFSSTEFDKFSTASLITRSTNDITQIQMVVMMMVRMVFYAPIMGVGGVIRAMGKGSSMWYLIAIAVLIMIGLIIIVFSIALPKFRMIQSLTDRINLVAREHLAGMMVIRAFNMQDFEEQRFDKANRDLTAVSLFINRLMVTMMPLMMLIMNVLSIAIIWVGAHQVAEANMQVGDMMAFLQYAMQIMFSFLMLSMMFIILPRASVSGDRIAEVLETEMVIKDDPQPISFPEPFKGTVEFRNVSFRYPGADEDVLHDISFTAQPGQTTAFIGSTGSGKSTIVNLLPRFYDVTAGQILIDGVDIRAVSQHDLRDKIGYIPQKSNLFSGTVESNLRYARETASEEEIQSAIRISQAAEFISSRPEGITMEISQGGANVSGGQRQRLSIARALVKKPPIYIFDDSFSALDFKTDSALRRALKQETGNSTLLIVTQRVSTIKNAEQIIVLDEGRIVSKGTHEELMETSDIYKEIACSQLQMEVL